MCSHLAYPSIASSFPHSNQLTRLRHCSFFPNPLPDPTHRVTTHDHAFAWLWQMFQRSSLISANVHVNVSTRLLSHDTTLVV